MDIEKMLKEITAAYNNFDYQSHLKQPDELSFLFVKRKLMSYGRGKMASIRETPKNLFANIWIVRLRSLIQVFFKAIRCLFRTKQIV